MDEKKGCKHGQNLNAKMETKLDAKLDASEVNVKVDEKWDAKKHKKIFYPNLDTKEDGNVDAKVEENVGDLDYDFCGAS